MSKLSCRKFKRLMHERFDRELSVKEQNFLQAHRTSCAECRLSEHQGALALSMLRTMAVEPELTPHFSERVIRRWHVSTVQDSLRFWSPAFLGALVAALLVLASLQLVSRSAQLPTVNLNGHEARRISPPDTVFPNIIEDAHGRR